MKKVFIGVGHGGADPGALGLNGLKEKDLNLAIALAARDELERHGVLVMMSRIKDENDPLSEEIAECNRFNPDVAIDFHNNAGGGDGFEAYYSVVGGMSKTLAIEIERQVKTIGQNSRGIKTKLQSDGRDWFGFVRQIKAPSVLCEFAFVDSKDVEIIDTPAEQKAMGIAAAKGILSVLGIAWKAPAQKLKRGYYRMGLFDEQTKKQADVLEIVKLMKATGRAVDYVEID